MPTRLPIPRERSDARRNHRALLEAAAEALAQNPGASMMEVARVAQLTRATVYRHFSNHGELIDAMRAELLERARLALAAARLDEGPALDALRRAVDALVPLGLRFRAILAEGNLLDPESVRERAELLAPVLHVIEHGQQAGSMGGHAPSPGRRDAHLPHAFTRGAPARRPVPSDIDVLVVGAGPTGPTAAYEALRHGLTVRIIDRKPGREAISKALVVHARTMEVFEAMGLAEAVLAEGLPFAALNVHAGRNRAVRINLRYVTEQIIETRLRTMGTAVEWQVLLRTIVDRGDHVEANLVHARGRAEMVRARWLIGCDGGRSTVREWAGLRLKRSDAGARFVLADVGTTAQLAHDEGHVHLGRAGLLLIVPMPEPGRRRIIAHLPEAVPSFPPTIDTAFLDRLIRDRAGIEFGGHDITWVSCFNLSHGLADRYRRGRVFLAGDAAHVHSPVGGQGLNTGIQEAHNLLWKIAAADRLGKEAAEQLLDSYETERRPIAQRMVKGTARATAVMTSNRRITQIVRAGLGPRVLGHPSIQARLGRQVGMLETAYRSEPAAGASAGRRMADPELRSGGRLHPRLSDRSHTWVAWVRPDEPAPDPDDATWRGLPVLLLTDGVLAPAQPWPDESERVALVRPDRYVAATGRTPEAIWSALQRYAHGSLPVPGVTRAGSTAGNAAEPSKIPSTSAGSGSTRTTGVPKGSIQPA